jgi:DNA-binding transcriptional LysR family regulator
LSAPVDTTQQVVAEAVAGFCSAHPSIRVVVHPTDALQNVLADALDVSVRYGALLDSTLVARKLAESPRVFVASPEYLERRGAPKTADDLEQHRLLTLQLGNSAERSWRLFRSGSKRDLHVDSPLCGDGLVVRRWAIAGHGIAFKALFDVVDDLQSGQLVRVLPDVRGAVVPIHAVFPSKTFIPARVRSLVDHLADAFSVRQSRCQSLSEE